MLTKICRETVSALHKASTSSSESVRNAAMESLEVVALQMPLMALQTWLDQFARTNGGSSQSEYAAKDRIFMLTTLERITAKMVSDEGNLDELNVANRACVGRIIAMGELVKDILITAKRSVGSLFSHGGDDQTVRGDPGCAKAMLQYLGQAGREVLGPSHGQHLAQVPTWIESTFLRRIHS